MSNQLANSAKQSLAKDLTLKALESGYIPKTSKTPEDSAKQLANYYNTLVANLCSEETKQ